jgi:hypothetical protein
VPGAPGLAVGEVDGDGTAFAVSDAYGLTAAHVVEDAETTVQVRFGAEAVPATVEARDGVADLALLHFAAPPPPGLRRVRLSDEVEVGDRFLAVGFPALPPLDLQVDRVAVDGLVLDPGSVVGQAPAIELRVEQSGTVQPLSLHGMSGGPVLAPAGPQDDIAVGVIRWNPEQDTLAIGSLCYAAPAATALAAWRAQLQGAFVRPRLQGLLAAPLAPGAELPTVGGLDFGELGVVADGAAWRAGHAPYVRRECDRALDAALRDRAVPCLLVVGEPRAGKTRTAYEALLRCHPDRPVIVPGDWPAFAELVDRDARRPLADGLLLCVLDEVDRYLASGRGAMLVTLNRFLSRPAGAVLVATIRSDQLALLQATDGGTERQRVLVLRALEHDHGPPVEVPRLPQPRELADAAHLYPSETFPAGVGIGEHLGRASALRARYQGEASSTRRALVQMAVDFRRTGRGLLMSKERLRAWFDAALSDDPVYDVNPDRAFEDAMLWAVSPIYPGSSRLALLQAPSGVSSGYTPDDYLTAVDDGVAGGVARPISPAAWDQAFSDADPELCLDMTIRAGARADWWAALRGAAIAEGAPRIGTPLALARWIRYGGREAALEETLTALKRAAGEGMFEASMNLALYSTTWEEFRTWIDRAVGQAAGENAAMLFELLGRAHAARGDLPAALDAWREGAKVRDGGVPSAIAALRAATVISSVDRQELLDAAVERVPSWRTVAELLRAEDQAGLGDGVRAILQSTDWSMLDIGVDVATRAALTAGPGAVDPAAVAEIVQYRIPATAHNYATLSKQEGRLDSALRWFQVAIGTAQVSRLDPAVTHVYVPAYQSARIEFGSAFNFGNLMMDRKNAALARWAFAHAVDAWPDNEWAPAARQRAAEARSMVGFAAMSRYAVAGPYPFCPFCRYEAVAHRDAYSGPP